MSRSFQIIVATCGILSIILGLCAITTFLNKPHPMQVAPITTEITNTSSGYNSIMIDDDSSTEQISSYSKIYLSRSDGDKKNKDQKIVFFDEKNHGNLMDSLSDYTVFRYKLKSNGRNPVFQIWYVDYDVKDHIHKVKNAIVVTNQNAITFTSILYNKIKETDTSILKSDGKLFYFINAIPKSSLKIYTKDIFDMKYYERENAGISNVLLGDKTFITSYLNEHFTPVSAISKEGKIYNFASHGNERYIPYNITIYRRILASYDENSIVKIKVFASAINSKGEVGKPETFELYTNTSMALLLKYIIDNSIEEFHKNQKNEAILRLREDNNNFIKSAEKEVANIGGEND